MKGIPIPTILPSQIPLVPFPETFFQSPSFPDESGKHHNVFVPFLGDLFSITVVSRRKRETPQRFRPLSRGLFFNEIGQTNIPMPTSGFSSPFLETFFQFHFDLGHQVYHPKTFSSPFSGTFFNDYARFTNVKSRILVFVPFLGDLFSIKGYTGNIERS